MSNPLKAACSLWARRFFLAGLPGWVCLLALGITGCGEAPQTLLTVSEKHMGTVFTIRSWTPENRLAEANLAIVAAFQRIAEIEQVASDYIPDSELNRLAHAPVGEPISLSDDLFALLDHSLTLAQETEGAFDPTIGPLVKLWRRTKKASRLPTESQIAEIRKRFGHEKLILDRSAQTATLSAENMALDLGGIAKGYASDAALEVLREAGFPRSLVAGSGDIVLGDPPPHAKGWRVGVRSLDVDAVGENERLTGTVLLSNAAISTSGDTQNYITVGGVRYSHIVDPVTALGKTERIAVTIIASDATTTDSYATAINVMGAERGLAFVERKAGVECLILVGDAPEETRSTGFPVSE